MQTDTTAPREYARRLEARQRTVEDRLRVERLLSWGRLALFLVSVVVAWFAFGIEVIHGGWVVLPAAAFAAAALAHGGVIRQRRRTERAADFYRRGIERLEGRWSGRGNPGERFIDPEHPYTADLDVFGTGSLFELLCAARTVSGERILAGWLSGAAEPAELRRRQAAVDELRPMLDLREDLAVLGQTVGRAVDPDRLIAWGAAARELTARWPVVVGGLLAVLNVVTLTMWFAPLLQTATRGLFEEFRGSAPFLVAVVVSGLFVLVFRERVQRVLHEVERPERELEVLSQLLSRIERESFRSPLLRELRAELDSAGHPPSRRIAQLARWAQMNDSRDNLVFRPFAALVLLGTQLAFAMERWRAASGTAVEKWVTALGRIEALSSLAGFAYEFPEAPFPEIEDHGPLFEGRGLSHPLLPVGDAVPNDLRLGDDLRLFIVSGSNMSGKSTLLRTVGVNAVLALAGAPVRAESLRLSPLAVGACMRVQDSLQAGLSHFYAEIRRLKSLVDLGQGPRPLFFLLDEILHGTNSHDRRSGAEALIRGLVDRGAVGLVTTHDLALAGIAERLGPRAANVHFADHLEGDRVRFDFRLQDGVVRKSNALDLMRAIGLDV